ncbi:hypothetical protein BGW39_001470 [Mortierella sp. 14UC]|nr:hypothetical protein BGW39_001470 [Mortierella sp. 14UC]
MAAVTARNTPPTRTFHRLGPSALSSATASLTVPSKAATAANSTQLPSSLAAAAMTAAQRARAAYSQAATSSMPIITPNRSNTSISVDSMTGPLTGNDYIGQFEKDRAQAQNVDMVVEGPFGSVNRIESYSSSINSFATTVNRPSQRHHGSSSALPYTPTSLSSTATLPVDLDDRHAKEMERMTGRGFENANLGFGSHLGFLHRPNYNSNNDEEDNNDIGSIRRNRQVSAQSDISEKLMHLSEPSPFEGMCSCRGLVNIISMLLILCGLMPLILGYPIASSLKKDRLTGEAATAAASTALADRLTQVRFAIDSQQHQQHQQGAGLVRPLSKTAASTAARVSRTAGKMVDPDTPEEKKMTVSKDGQSWDLGGNESALNGNGTLEHHSSHKVTTRNGQLKITLQRDLTSPFGAKAQKRDGSSLGSACEYTSGMLQSWNKMCFQTGILEVAVRLPGSPSKAGLKPRIFVLGNLARYGFPASMNGVWPFSTSSISLQCDTITASSISNTSSSFAQRLSGCSSGANKLG